MLGLGRTRRYPGYRAVYSSATAHGVWLCVVPLMAFAKKKQKQTNKGKHGRVWLFKGWNYRVEEKTVNHTVPNDTNRALDTLPGLSVSFYASRTPF